MKRNTCKTAAFSTTLALFFAFEFVVPPVLGFIILILLLGFLASVLGFMKIAQLNAMVIILDVIQEPERVVMLLSLSHPLHALLLFIGAILIVVAYATALCYLAHLITRIVFRNWVNALKGLKHG